MSLGAQSPAQSSPLKAQGRYRLKALKYSRSAKDIKPRSRPSQVLEDVPYARSSSKRPQSYHSSLESSICARTEYSSQTLCLSPKPRHIPIVIPGYGADTITNECAPASIDLDFDRRPSLPILPPHERTTSIDYKRSRPKHVPIVIHAIEHPFGQVPEIPESVVASQPSISLTTSPTFTPKPRRMSQPPPTDSRTSTIDSTVSAPGPLQLYGENAKPPSSTYAPEMNSSQSSLSRQGTQESSYEQELGNQQPQSAVTELTSIRPSPAATQHTPSVGNGTPSSSTTNLSGLVCNVHRTTGKEPHSLVGATTTILGDKLYVFGGRVLSRTRPQLTADLYELDLVRRHWTKVETKGDIPPPRYFHSVCPLGDTKLVCYGGMSPAVAPQIPAGEAAAPQTNPHDPQPEVVVMSDIHIYDGVTQTWTYVSTTDTPQGRYAHCATILPSSASFSSANAPLSAIHHNPASSNPNQGTIGVSLDGSGGAEMVVVGGQDSSNHYIEQISVFNLRSLKWTATSSLGRQCGAYRSVVAPLADLAAARIGRGSGRKDKEPANNQSSQDLPEGGSSMLIYSNYNFMDVKLELQVRSPDGTLTEKPMNGHYSPPGLRFPNGGIIDNHFIVSGTFLTSSKQEYALWALDLKTLVWSRIDTGGGVFSQGSWNRGILWHRTNTFVILGNRKRSLVEDYNHRRINFSNICVVELEAFGLHDNPRRNSPMSGYISMSSPPMPASFQPGKAGYAGGGRQLSSAAEELGQLTLGMRELADMDLLAVGGERVPVNSHLIARRWGPYFIRLLKEGATAQDGTDVMTLRPTAHGPSRNSSVTITPSVRTVQSTSTHHSAGTQHSGATTLTNNTTFSAYPHIEAPDTNTLKPGSRPRTLYLPHTYLTLQTLVHFLYTASLPAPQSPLCTPQILCSLLQLARPYQIDGLLEATVERLHQVLDERNAAAVFNAAAMAAGGGRGVGFTVGPVSFDTLTEASAANHDPQAHPDEDLVDGTQALRINTNVSSNNGTEIEDDVTSATSTNTNETGSSIVTDGERRKRSEVWGGDISAVVGLQKRGLRGLMEGRRMRERGRSQGAQGGAIGSVGEKVGLGIA
ncbi:MAG: hypothetical protein M1835_000481 [Candelina submexicana]|nr:MAG: hypothetical protein M1835_000481 [Candelina submexicana]